MSEERDTQTEQLDNWKPGDPSETECGIDCDREEDEHDCCSCCW